ncbi:MAG TPA: hypothetical protein VMT24_16645 [Aggregatilineaceae bacterium]|jgi:hypothetical protein|nr:hypothetical protein [Aggregatilineaceae bacterium]
MSSLPSGNADRWAKQIQETIASTSTVRDGLHDDEAIPLIEWGIACSEHLGRRMAAPGVPEPSPEQVDDAAYALVRLMTRVTWLVVYRNKKDAAWLTRTFAAINQLSHELYGEDAPVFSDDEIAAWIVEQSGHTNGELIQGLIARLTPASMGVSSTGSESPDAPVPPAQSGEENEPHKQQ